MGLDLETKQQLANLLAKPDSVTQAHSAMLTNLVQQYPYYQPLHLLLAKANHSNQNLASAALYNGGTLVHRVIYQAETFQKPNLTIVSSIANMADEKPITVNKNSDEPLMALADEQETFEEINETLNYTPKAEVEAEEEVFDEIVELNTAEFGYPSQEELSPTKQHFENVTGNDTETLPDELAIENIVATDFFAFENSFSTEQIVAQEKEKPNIPIVEEYNQEAEEQTVSKYNDDKLPYTFLWWLAKTRKEHEQIFQPYVTPKKSENVAPNNPSELQQQYVEHIFHLQTPFSIADEANKDPLNRQVSNKGADIIDSFIKNEPQIRAPKPEQINNENKAKKSAEDHNDLVSETLAAIYIEQMLYHKAIDTYEKLSLKFPEKSRYFADLIQSLEKKI